MMTRAELRVQSASYLNNLSREELFRSFGITRIGEVTALDSIGIPVMTACRPAAKIVSVNAGKSMERSSARAGAIAEAIEFSTFERPGPHDFGLAHPLDYPLTLGSLWTPQTPVAIEPIENFFTGQVVNFPSALIWLVRPGNEPSYFQKSSNGQAAGGSFFDAILQAMYECVERDQYVMRRISMQKAGVWPPLATLEHPAVRAIERAGLKLFLFYCTFDIPIPVYWAIITDPSWRHCGGWGAHIDPHIAAERAVLEAVQSRAVVISGARDDLERRDPDWTSSVAAIKELEALPVTHPLASLPQELSAEEELLLVFARLGEGWLSRTWFKHVEVSSLLHVVKVQILGLEQPVMGQWKELRWSKLIKKLAEQSSMSVQASMESVLNAFGGNNGADRHEPAISIPKLVLHGPRKRSS